MWYSSAFIIHACLYCVVSLYSQRQPLCSILIMASTVFATGSCVAWSIRSTCAELRAAQPRVLCSSHDEPAIARALSAWGLAALPLRFTGRVPAWSSSDYSSVQRAMHAALVLSRNVKVRHVVTAWCLVALAATMMIQQILLPTGVHLLLVEILLCLAATLRCNLRSLLGLCLLVW